MSAKGRLGWIATGAVTLGLLIYLQGLSGPWLFDDRPNLVDNAPLRIDPAVLDQWRTAMLSSGSGALRRPVSMFTFAVNTALPTGLTPASLKLTNIGIHCLTAWLLFGFFSSLVSNLGGCSRYSADAQKWIAFTAALIWFLHPLHVSTVLYSVQRMAQLSTLFIVAGLWLYTRYRAEWASRGASPGEVISALLWVLLLTLFAILSKENGILLLWLVLVVEVCVFCGTWNKIHIPWLARLSWVVLAFPAVVLILVFFSAPDWLVGRYGSRDFTLEERVMTQGRLLWQYLGWLIWPGVDSLGIHHDDIAVSRGLLKPVTTLLSLITWPLALLASLLLRSQFPLLAFAILFYLVGHSIESTVWPLMMVFEHRNYLPSAGFCLLIAWGLYSLAHRSGQVNPVVPGIAFAVLLCAFLFVRVSAWSDELSLSQANVLHHPVSSRSHYIHANNMLRHYQHMPVAERESAQGRDLLVASRYHFEQALDINPEDLGALVTLYQLDSTYFMALGMSDQWLHRIREILSHRRLNRQDLAAVKAFMRCLGANTCPGGKKAKTGVLEALSRRNPKWSQLAHLEHLYMSADGTAPEKRLIMLEPYLQAAPDNISLLQLALLDYVAIGEMGKAYEMGRRIMAADTGRWHTSLLKYTFPGLARLKLESQ